MSQDKFPLLANNQSNQNELSSLNEGAYKPLSQIKRQRKQIESDAKLLANRIALLKQEEIKTYKKIDETKKKAYEIYQLKVSNTQRIKQRKIQKEHNMFVIKEKKKTKQEQDLEEKRLKLKQFNEIKQMHTKEVKQLKEINKKKKQQQVQKIQEEMKLRNQLIRKQEELGKQRIQEYQMNKHNFYQEQYLSSYSVEEQVKKLKEMEILKMEKLEAELIQKLQQSQLYQKEAYDQLENALSLKPEEFADKYINSSKVEEGNNQKQETNDNKAFITQDIEKKEEQNKKVQDQKIEKKEVKKEEQKEEKKEEKKLEKPQQEDNFDQQQFIEIEPTQQKFDNPQKNEEQPHKADQKQEQQEELQQKQELPKEEQAQKQQHHIKVSDLETQLNGLTESLGLEKQYIKAEYNDTEEVTEVNDSNGDNLKWLKVCQFILKDDASEIVIKLFAESNQETSLVAEGILNIKLITTNAQQKEIDLINKEKQQVGKLILNAILEEQ